METLGSGLQSLPLPSNTNIHFVSLQLLRYKLRIFGIFCLQFLIKTLRLFAAAGKSQFSVDHVRIVLTVIEIFRVLGFVDVKAWASFVPFYLKICNK